MEVHAEIYKGGRVTIPKEIRNELGITEGDKVTFQLEDNELRILTLQQKLERARAILKRNSNWENISTDGFLDWRRNEARREAEEMNHFDRTDSSS